MQNFSIPVDEAQKLKAIQLYRSPRVGARSYHRLMDGVGHIDQAFERLAQVISKNKILDYQMASMESVKAEYMAGHQFGAELIFSVMRSYPKSFYTQIDRPPFLWVKGRTELLGKRNVAIIGSRNPTIEGIRMARQIALELADAGIAVISGLARGIDTAAHEGALAGGTIAVVAGGVDVFAPKENERLQKNIFERGLVISEMPIGHQPQASNFPMRNRIIAGLADAVIVVEAGQRSGTAITVHSAGDLGREIMAVPGHPFEPLSRLPNQLLREGAHMVCQANDVLDALKPIWEIKRLDEAAEDTNFAPSGVPVPEFMKRDQLSHASRNQAIKLSQYGRSLLEQDGPKPNQKNVRVSG